MREFRELCPDPSVLMRKKIDAAAADASVTRLRDAYVRFLRGEPAPLVDLLAPDAVYPLPGRHMGGGQLEGREAILRRAAAALRACEAPPSVAVLGACGDPSVVLTEEQYSARRGGRRLEQRLCVVWRFEQDRCVELWAHFENQGACDAFWADWPIPQP